MPHNRWGVPAASTTEHRHNQAGTLGSSLIAGPEAGGAGRDERAKQPLGLAQWDWAGRGTQSPQGLLPELSH